MRSRLEWGHLALITMITLVVAALWMVFCAVAIQIHEVVRESWGTVVEFLLWTAALWMFERLRDCLKALREQWQEGKA